MESVPLEEGIPSYLIYFVATKGTPLLESLGQISSWEWFAIFFCLILSSLFSASETALTALSYAKIDQLINKDSKRFGRFKLWLEQPNRVLTTILIGNNAVNILASALSTSIAERIFGNSGVAIAVGVMTFVILISGEVVPKTYAKHHAEQVASRLFPLLRLTHLIVAPITSVLVRIASWVVRIFGKSLSQNGPFITQDDLEYMIGLGTREGVFDEEKEKLLQSILEFDDITIREIMVPRINMIALSVDATPEEALQLANNSAHSRIPVYEGQLDNVTGILYLRDLFRTHTGEGLSSEWTELLRTPYFVPGTMKISDLLKEFQRRKSHLAIVVDEFGGTMGLVTLEDILEEIVGEIHDEFDPDDVDKVQEVIKVSEGVFQAGARVSIRELGERLALEFPDDGDYETLGGFVTAISGRVPQTGEHIEWDSNVFVILDADEKHVQRVKIHCGEKDPQVPSQDELPEISPPTPLPATKSDLPLASSQD